MIYKELRKQHGETIKQTAAAIGISASHLGRIESGKRTLTEEIEEKLKKHFGIDFKVGDKIVLVDESKLILANGDHFPTLFTNDEDRIFEVMAITSTGTLYTENARGMMISICRKEFEAIKKLDEPHITPTQDNKQERQAVNKDDAHNKRCTRYRKPIPKDWDYIDVYRVCDLFEVDDSSGATQQAVKKLIASGTRGYKDKLQDYKEAEFAIQERIRSLESKEDA